MGENSPDLVAPETGLKDFSSYNIPKREKHTNMATKCANWQ
jgi:hypothetical protein